eukprot:jgi/Picsp_1/4087/NSC_01597-R1_methionyl-trna formyltransferase
MNSIISYEYRCHRAAVGNGIGRLNAALLSGYHSLGLKTYASSSAAWRTLDALGACKCTFTNISIYKERVEVPGSALEHSSRRRQFCCWRRQVLAKANLDSTTVEERKKRVVFLGTPEVAALVLKKLVYVSREEESTFRIVGVVTQPGRPKGRRNKGVPQPSPVEVFAREESLETILCPIKASEEDFLDTMRELSPDLCITAAYGNYLPSSFLKIPKFGTLNIHPSLLPAYRGAAPVQRAVEDGLEVSGVTVLYTVKKMDAGPILAQKEYQLNGDVQTPELLNTLFNLGTDLLVEKLPDVWSGRDKDYIVAQNDDIATHAAKLGKEEGRLNFHESALVCHNKVRAFAGWPGTYHEFEIYKDGNDVPDIAQIKILKTRLSSDGNSGKSAPENGKVAFSKDAMQIICGDGRVLEVLELQSPGKKSTNAQAFKNGLTGKYIKWKRQKCL